MLPDMLRLARVSLQIDCQRTERAPQTRGTCSPPRLHPESPSSRRGAGPLPRFPLSPLLPPSAALPLPARLSSLASSPPPSSRSSGTFWRLALVWFTSLKPVSHPARACPPPSVPSPLLPGTGLLSPDSPSSLPSWEKAVSLSCPLPCRGLTPPAGLSTPWPCPSVTLAQQPPVWPPFPWSFPPSSPHQRLLTAKATFTGSPTDASPHLCLRSQMSSTQHAAKVNLKDVWSGFAQAVHLDGSRLFHPPRCLELQRLCCAPASNLFLQQSVMKQTAQPLRNCTTSPVPSPPSRSPAALTGALRALQIIALKNSSPHPLKLSRSKRRLSPRNGVKIHPSQSYTRSLKS